MANVTVGEYVKIEYLGKDGQAHKAKVVVDDDKKEVADKEDIPY